MTQDDNKNEANSPFTTSGTSPPATQVHEWMNAEEAALYLRCAVKSIYNYKCNGQLKGHNMGGRKKGKLRFRKTDLDAFIYGKRGA